MYMTSENYSGLMISLSFGNQFILFKELLSHGKFEHEPNNLPVLS